LKITTEPREDHQVQITAELEPEILQQYKRRAARKISEQAKVPGFRPGKAPYDVIRRLYGEDAIQSQAIELIVDDYYPKVLEEAKIDPSGPGTLEKIINQDPPTFSFTVPLMPEIILPDYRSVRKEYHLETVTDEDVDRYMRILQRSHATIEPAERSAEKGDLVYLKISARFMEVPEGEEVDFIKETPLQVFIGDESPENDNWPYKGFSNELIGLSANEEKTIQYVYPDSHESEKLRGRSVEFKVVVQSVKSLTLPELNDEFAKTVGEFETLQELKERIHVSIEQNRIQEYDQKFLNELVDQIVEQSIIKYPPQVLDHQIEHAMEDLESDLKQRSMDLPTYLKTRNMSRDELIANEIRPVSKRRLERSLVLEEISKQEKISVQPEELESAFAATMQGLRESPGFDKYQKGASRRDFNQAVVLDTANRLFNQHLMERLKNIAMGLQEVEKTGEDEIGQAEAKIEGNESPAASNLETQAIDSVAKEESISPQSESSFSERINESNKPSD